MTYKHARFQRTEQAVLHGWSEWKQLDSAPQTWQSELKFPMLASLQVITAMLQMAI